MGNIAVKRSYYMQYWKWYFGEHMVRSMDAKRYKKKGKKTCNANRPLVVIKGVRFNRSFHTGAWDEQLIYDNFWPDDAETIMAIPVEPLELDSPAWHYDSKGNFSVKPTYKSVVQIRDKFLQKTASGSGSYNGSNGEF